MLRKRKNKAYKEPLDEEADSGRKFDLTEPLKSDRFDQVLDKYLLKMTGQEMNLKLIQMIGFDKPILLVKPDGLNLKMPPKSFLVRDVKNCVGSDRIIDVMDVKTQKNIQMTMKDFCKYYESKHKDKLLNVISLEFSHTKLDELVESPMIVKLLDWVDLVWPKALKESQTESTNTINNMKYPKVQKYCLMSVKGSYTDFHIDFGGTSVWYHIIRGRKIFWMVPPTELNLQVFEHWTLSGNPQHLFLGDTVEDCFRVELGPGNTFFIPSGWIHAVYTLEDSLVFGGNFLHSFSIENQLRVSKIEDATKVPAKFRYPFYTELSWYVIQHYVHCLTGRDHLHKIEPFLEATNKKPIKAKEAINCDNKEQQRTSLKKNSNDDDEDEDDDNDDDDDNTENDDDDDDENSDSSTETEAEITEKSKSKRNQSAAKKRNVSKSKAVAKSATKAKAAQTKQASKSNKRATNKISKKPPPKRGSKSKKNNKKIKDEVNTSEAESETDIDDSLLESKKDSDEDDDEDSTDIDSSSEETIKKTPNTCRMTKNSLSRLQYEVLDDKSGVCSPVSSASATSHQPPRKSIKLSKDDNVKSNKKNQQQSSPDDADDAKSNISEDTKTVITSSAATASFNHQATSVSDQQQQDNSKLNLSQMMLSYSDTKLNGWSCSTGGHSIWSETGKNEKESSNKVHLTRFELDGLKALMKHLSKLSGTKKNLPSLIRNSRVLLDDCRKMLAEHENDDPKLAATGKPITLESMKQTELDMNELIAQYFKPSDESPDTITTASSTPITSNKPRKISNTPANSNVQSSPDKIQERRKESTGKKLIEKIRASVNRGEIIVSGSNNNHHHMSGSNDNAKLSAAQKIKANKSLNSGTTSGSNSGTISTPHSRSTSTIKMIDVIAPPDKKKKKSSSSSSPSVVISSSASTSSPPNNATTSSLKDAKNDSLTSQNSNNNNTTVNNNNSNKQKSTSKEETKCLSPKKASQNLSSSPSLPIRPESPPTRPISNNQYRARNDNDVTLPNSFADLIAATSTNKPKVYDVTGLDVKKLNTSPCKQIQKPSAPSNPNQQPLLPFFNPNPKQKEQRSTIPIIDPQPQPKPKHTSNNKYLNKNISSSTTTTTTTASFTPATSTPTTISNSDLQAKSKTIDNQQHQLDNKAIRSFDTPVTSHQVTSPSSSKVIIHRPYASTCAPTSTCATISTTVTATKTTPLSSPGTIIQRAPPVPQETTPSPNRQSKIQTEKKQTNQQDNVETAPTIINQMITHQPQIPTDYSMQAPRSKSQAQSLPKRIIIPAGSNQLMLSTADNKHYIPLNHQHLQQLQQEKQQQQQQLQQQQQNQQQHPNPKKKHQHQTQAQQQQQQQTEVPRLTAGIPVIRTSLPTTPLPQTSQAYLPTIPMTASGASFAAAAAAATNARLAAAAAQHFNSQAALNYMPRLPIIPVTTTPSGATRALLMTNPAIMGAVMAANQRIQRPPTSTPSSVQQSTATTTTRSAIDNTALLSLATTALSTAPTTMINLATNSTPNQFNPMTLGAHNTAFATTPSHAHPHHHGLLLNHPAAVSAGGAAPMIALRPTQTPGYHLTSTGQPVFSPYLPRMPVSAGMNMPNHPQIVYLLPPYGGYFMNNNRARST